MTVTDREGTSFTMTHSDPVIETIVWGGFEERASRTAIPETPTPLARLANGSQSRGARAPRLTVAGNAPRVTGAHSFDSRLL